MNTQQPNNEAFWSDPDLVHRIVVEHVNGEIPVRRILAPTMVDRDCHTTIPATFLQGGGFSEFEHGSLSSDGLLVLVDVDRNSAQIQELDQASDEPEDLPPMGPRQPTDTVYALEPRSEDLAPRFFPDLAHTVGRYALVALLPDSGTETAAFRVGPGPDADFEAELAAHLARLPARKTVPEEFLEEVRPWKAMAAPASLAPGLRIAPPPSGESAAILEFALPELPTELLHLEPGSVLPDGNRPPDAAVRIHLVAIGTDHHALALLLPAFSGYADGLLRGRFSLDLRRLLPGWVHAPRQALWAFHGPDRTESGTPFKPW